MRRQSRAALEGRLAAALLAVAVLSLAACAAAEPPPPQEQPPTLQQLAALEAGGAHPQAQGAAAGHAAAHARLAAAAESAVGPAGTAAPLSDSIGVRSYNKSALKIVIIPGVTLCNVNRWWYASIRDHLQARIPVILQKMPDCGGAHESIWIPFMRNNLTCDENTIIIGHSSGAEAAMRFAERWPTAGVVLVSPCYTDLGLASERRAGWYNRPWNWTAIKQNSGNFLMQFSSSNDPLISYKRQQLYVHEQLGTELHTLQKGHFLIGAQKGFPELEQALSDKLTALGL